MHWNEVWQGKGTVQKVARAALIPVSWLYCMGWTAYESIYHLGIKRQARPHTPIVCIGNLTVGGSGKTPLTVYIARLLKELGCQVAIGCSGYGSPAARGASLAPAGDLSALKWGDEATLFRMKLPEFPLIVGRHRVKAAQLCPPESVLLMDDGFQHLPLAKDITILIDTPGPNKHCLPAGPYREPSSRRNRADLVIPGDYTMVSQGLQFIDAKSGIDAVRPLHANVLCAIGSPERFIESLEVLGVAINKRVIKSDHDSLQEGNLFAPFPSDEPIVVTEKDWTKIRERRDLEGKRFLIARHEVKIQPEAQFIKWFQDKLHEVNPQRN